MKLTRYPETYNPILEYWQAIENGRETVSLKVQKTYRHVVEQLGATDSEFYYSPRRANHVLEFFENYCHHSKGKAGGQLVKLELWEKALLATVFGFIDIEGNRQYREAILIVGKKNGKSLLASGVGLYLQLADGEAGRRSTPWPPSETRRRSSGRRQSGWSRSHRRSAAGCAVWSKSWTAILTTAFSNRWPLTATLSTASTSTGP